MSAIALGVQQTCDRNVQLGMSIPGNKLGIHVSID